MFSHLFIEHVAPGEVECPEVVLIHGNETDVYSSVDRSWHVVTGGEATDPLCGGHVLVKYCLGVCMGT